MRIISTTDLDREGNDCYIFSSITLMEDRELYFVVLVERVAGYPYHKEVTLVGEPTPERLIAEFNYKGAGGVFKENEPHMRMLDTTTGRG